MPDLDDVGTCEWCGAELDLDEVETRRVCGHRVDFCPSCARLSRRSPSKTQHRDPGGSRSYTPRHKVATRLGDL